MVKFQQGSGLEDLSEDEVAFYDALETNDSPTGSIIQIEDHEVDLEGVRMLQLIVSPEIKRGSAVATMASWRLAY